jgi:hypothetical protein
MKSFSTFFIVLFVLIFTLNQSQGFRIMGTFIGGKVGFGGSGYYGGPKGGDFQARKNYGGRRNFENVRGHFHKNGGYRTVGGYRP